MDHVQHASDGVEVAAEAQVLMHCGAERHT